MAAGASSRLFPLAQDTHKSMISLCGKPLLLWTLSALKRAGIQDVIVVASPQDKKLQKLLANYHGLKIKKVLQEKPLGMGDALLSAKRYLKEEFLLVYGNQIDVGEFTSELNKSGKGLLLVDKTDEPWEYGMLEFRGKHALGIIEKPKKGNEPSNIRASGLYSLNQDFIRVLEKTRQKEYQFETALDTYMRQASVEVVQAKRKVLQLKYPWHLFELRDWLLEKLPQRVTKTQIAKTATVSGKVIMEEGARVFDYALVQGPVYIGRDAVVGAYSILRQGSILEEKAEIQRFVDCARSIIGPDSQVHTGFVGDSILGSGVRIGAGLVTANRRIDRENIKVRVQGAWVNTKRSYMGALIGDRVGVGVNVTVMPGVVIGADSSIGPNSVVMENVGANSLFFTDYKKIARVKNG